MRQGPQAEKAVVDRDNDNTPFGETDTVIHRVTAVSDAQAAAVKPNHDRASFVGIDGTCPNIQIQAVFRHLLAAPDPEHDERAAIRLRADRSEIGSIPFALPGSCRHWRVPSEGAGRCRGIGNAKEP